MDLRKFFSEFRGQPALKTLHPALRPSIKNVRSQGEGVVQCGHFSGKGGSSDADVRTF